MNNKRILFLDIEASNLAASIGFLLAIGYKWAGERETHVLRIDETEEFQVKKTDDTGLLKAFEPIYNQAEVIVYHFGDFYDLPFIQTRRLIKRMKPLPEVSSVDTWKICRKKLKFHNNRLDTILQALGCPIKKTAVMGEKWVDAMSGDSKGLDYIVDHCNKDVRVLEWVYNKIKAVWPHHPNMSSHSLSPREKTCPICAKPSGRHNGTRRTIKKLYQRLVCSNCGHSWKGGEIKEII